MPITAEISLMRRGPFLPGKFFPVGSTPCLEVLDEALAKSKHGRANIFNRGQGCQLTRDDFTGILKDKGIEISMDGKRPCGVDNALERLWRSLKYEEVYLKAYDTVAQAKEYWCLLTVL